MGNKFGWLANPGTPPNAGPRSPHPNRPPHQTLEKIAVSDLGWLYCCSLGASFSPFSARHLMMKGVQSLGVILAASAF